MDQPRNRHAPIATDDMTLRGCGLGRHGPDSASRCYSVVRAPRRSFGYAFVALPRIRGRGAPNAGCPHSSATCQTLLEDENTE